jgi:hypothetical protein
VMAASNADSTASVSSACDSASGSTFGWRS